MKRTTLADSLLIAVLAIILIWPLFRLKYMDNWPSIESTFISDARMLSDHLPHPGWQPLWYCGTRYDYIYPPALRYGPALIAKAGHLTTARAYHLYTAFLYVFGILAVYWLVLTGTASRMAALMSAAGTALLSPSFALLRVIRADSGYWVPQRLHVLMAYGEGPHISALCILPAALAASMLALRKWRPGMFAAAAVLCALVVSNNFYGATSLAIFFPILVWAVWTQERDWRIIPRAAGIAALAWGLCAIWLTPSYVKITLINLKWVAQPASTRFRIVTFIVMAVYCAITFRLRSGRAWQVFVTGVALFLSLDILGYYYLGLTLVGDPPRLIPELDLALILVVVEVARRWRAATVLVAAAAMLLSVTYLRHAWTPFPKSGSIESQYPFQMSKWVHDNLPGQRVMPTGELRFWFDAWWDNAQSDGGSMQGMLNQIIPAANWQIMVGDKPGPAISWLQALGTDAIVVVNANSREHYHDYKYPGKFVGALPVLYDNGQGTVVYRIPRIYPNIGRVVDKVAIGSVGEIRGGEDPETFAKYLPIVENPDQPQTTVEWKGFDEVDIQAKTAPGRSVLLQETWDSSWHAFEGDKELPVRPEPVMGFMLIDTPAGDHAIRMQFKTPLENRAGQLLLGLSLLVVAGLVLAGFGAAGGLGVFTGGA